MKRESVYKPLKWSKCVWWSQWVSWFIPLTWSNVCGWSILRCHQESSLYFKKALVPCWSNCTWSFINYPGPLAPRSEPSKLIIAQSFHDTILWVQHTFCPAENISTSVYSRHDTSIQCYPLLMKSLQMGPKNNTNFLGKMPKILHCPLKSLFRMIIEPIS